MSNDVLTVQNVSKTFLPTIIALESASLGVKAGEVHCLLGANGAGKSTLLKIIAGAFRPTEGRLVLEGRPVELRNPAEASRLGISMIYQELDLVPQLTVEQNLFLGHAPGKFGLINRKDRRKRASEALKRVGANFTPDVRVETLSVANQQLTAIARSLTMDAKIIIMDEPSASLNETELKSVFEVIRDLVKHGVAIVYVSHRLGELREIGDRVTVLRGGRTIGTYEIADTSDEALVTAIIGKERSLVERKERKPVTGEVALHVNRLRGAEGLDITGLEVRWGEVVGLTGLNGSGRTSFLKALFGAHHFEGEIMLDDERFHPRHSADAIRRGLGLVPENRKTEGLILHAPIYKNATLPSMRESWLTRHSFQKQRTIPVLKSLSTKYGKPEQAVVQLSGGNQQKVVLAKWIINGARVLLLDEPSRGLDIGAKADLYDLVDKLAEDGAAVIVASSELEELYAACDAIWVFHEGRNIGRYDPFVTDRDTILRATILGEHHV
ncbi:sugar ABC transporter ATP-binding protein [Phyllobacterium phragmitis]|uniref:Sugar ABC transporter ATP-binding protein n=1 Tax=Phyllobacterium phragmitis TaxID=2670329 RepID=A0A2S9IJL0_9HYPH|nr:sugar ABC transporter ATP-binding protein [Phyllobacterium phragmitis]PRD40707.1 sugar ABC transporter ATP-binding protein [Phyllobacterium phragmitis]